MRILVYGINYYPEMTGIGKYTAEMCEWLAKQGHEVDVITAVPYYPSWRIHSGYTGKKWHLEMINGVKVYRTPLYVPQKVSGFTRLLHDFSFMVSSMYYWVKLITRPYDVLFCIYPPLAIGLFPVLFQLFRNIPIIFHVQDLQVDAARQLGIIRRPGLLNLLEKAEKYFLNRATCITTLSEGMKKKILNKGIPKDKVQLFPNWVNTEMMRPYPHLQVELKEKYGYDSWQKVVLYSGNIGMKQGLGTLLMAAQQLQRQGNDNIQIIIVGEGAAKKVLQQKAQDLQLKNVRFAPLVPNEELTNLLNMADLHLVLQRQGASDLVMPSKLSSILACGGVPLIAAEEGSSLRTLAEREGFGITTDPECPQCLMYSMLDALKQDLAVRRETARRYADHHLDKNTILKQFSALMYEIVESQLEVPAPVKA